ncbi:PepSY-associated TM helix domain-containing protein [Reyranella sp.]|uniref:PepSY-associated TM helix domain-containing protein n=1 Tax=Reyranella sp. TaxID=1929291 RepID=UPI0025EAD1C2|nr:PepSY-associated TM helix domain-containing protein [Reyranella sp.]
MNWLHTWAGVVLGGLLFAIFWMGTLSVFDREIDLWMKPATRMDSSRPVAADILAREMKPFIGDAIQWFMLFPTEREPAVRIGYRGESGPFVQRSADPATMALLPEAGTLAGTGFIFPFHYSLHIRFASLGYWIVGLAAMAMMALCVSGVVIHRKIFTDFFTFRADKKPRRLMLDLHNVAGVLGLPFHFMITLSGVIIFFSIYFPTTMEFAYGDDRRAFNREAFGNFSRPKANAPAAASASLDGLLADASRRWDGGRPYFLRVWHPGDANSYVEIRRAYDDAITMNLDVLYFDAAAGELLRSSSTSPVMTAQRFISGLHFVQFRHWTLRWVYFALGLTGCLLIATGYFFWLESRRRKHEQMGLRGVRVVEGLTVGSVTGIVIATLSFFVVNRLLPSGAKFLGEERAALEVWTFYLVWLATFAHAWLRPGRAWLEQCWTVAALALAAVGLNWMTTGHHLGRSLAQPHLHAIAGMDLLLSLGGAGAALAALRLARRTRATVRGTRPQHS